MAAKHLTWLPISTLHLPYNRCRRTTVVYRRQQGGNRLPRPLEFSRQIAIDLKADADFDKDWCSPSHWVSSSAVWVNRNKLCRTKCFLGV